MVIPYTVYKYILVIRDTTYNDNTSYCDVLDSVGSVVTM